MARQVLLAFLVAGHMPPGPAGAQICWTLGITEHHSAADNVFALMTRSAPGWPS